MPRVNCPNCQQPTTLAEIAHEADEFCAHPVAGGGPCDFPLFWAPEVLAMEAAAVDGSLAGSLRRLPGTQGRIHVATIVCPHCSELNPALNELCLRCGLPLKVEEPEPVVVVTQVVEVVPDPPAAPGRVMWPWVLLAVALVALVLWLLFGVWS